MADQTTLGRGPIYEYMMGTFDLGDATWMTQMNDMLNNFGIAGWRRSVCTLLNARHMLVVMERKYPSPEAMTEMQDAKPEPEAETGPEPTDDALYEEFDEETEVVMAAKVAEVIPWSARPAVPARKVQHRRKQGRKKMSGTAHRNKAMT